MNNEKFPVGAEIEFDVPHRQKMITIRLSFETALLLISAFLLLVIGLAHAGRYPKQPENAAVTAVNETIALQSTATALPAPSDVEVQMNKKDHTVRADLSATPTVKKPITLSFSTEEEKQDSAYIRRFQRVAIAEMEKFGIPASISMAQGLLESNAGQSRLAREINNHFGIKCHSKTCQPGHCDNYHDDSAKDFFVRYGNAWESWRAHSKLLADPSRRYAGFIKSCGNDYLCWAKGLKKKGYATAPRYDKKLIDLIEKYQLHRLDGKQLLLN